MCCCVALLTKAAVYWDDIDLKCCIMSVKDLLMHFGKLSVMFCCINFAFHEIGESTHKVMTCLYIRMRCKVWKNDVAKFSMYFSCRRRFLW